MLQREDLRLAADQSELFTYSIIKNRYMGLNDSICLKCTPIILISCTRGRVTSSRHNLKLWGSILHWR